jgi:NhaC family Na+:H+ antiporter
VLLRRHCRFFNKVSFKKMMEEVAENIKSTVGAILILLMVGAWWEPG